LEWNYIYDSFKEPEKGNSCWNGIIYMILSKKQKKEIVVGMELYILFFL
jgi:hypothetical protein